MKSTVLDMMVGSVERGQLVNKLVGGQVRCRYTYDWRHRNAMRWHIIAPHKWRVGMPGVTGEREAGRFYRCHQRPGGRELNIEGGVKPARCLILPFLVLHEIAFINVGVWASKCQKQRFAIYIQSTNLRFIGIL